VRPARGAEGFTCDIMIYDEEADRHVRIRWVDAMAACCIVDTKDRPGGADLVGANAADFIGAAINLSPQGVGGTTGQWRDAAMSIAAFNAGTDNGGDAYADDAAYSTRYNNLNKNIRIVIARPFIEHLMHSVIVCVSGRDTGATLFGPADMQLSANTQVKTIEGAHFTIRTPPTNHTRTPISLGESDLWLHAGHYTGHFKAVITKPQNVLVMRDVACAGYVAGCNTQWFAHNYPDADARKWSLSKAQTNMMKRLSFADDVGAKYSSMLAFPCYAQQFESGHLDTVMSVTTRLLPWEVTTATGGDHMSFPGGQEAFTAYSGKLNLRSVHFGEDMKVRNVASNCAILVSSPHSLHSRRIPCDPAHSNRPC